MAGPSKLSVSHPLKRLLGIGKGRKPGRPPLDWTPSRERKLVRLIDSDVPWTDIATAMVEGDFTPSRSNCQAQWKKITDMPVDKLRVKNPKKKAQRKALAVNAFVAHERRGEPLVISPVRVQETLEAGFGNSVFSSVSSSVGNETFSVSTPNVHAPTLLSSDGPTPGPIDTLTPIESHDFYDDLVAIQDSMGGMTPRQPDSPAYDTMEEVSKKRPLPYGFDPETSRAVRRQFGPPAQSPVGQARPTAVVEAERSTMFDEKTFNDNIHAVEGRLYKDVADLEKKMGHCPGFIDFVRNRLSITGASVTSAMSPSGSVRSRWSRKHSRQTSHDTTPELEKETKHIAQVGDGVQRVRLSPSVRQAVITRAQDGPTLCELLASRARDDSQAVDMMLSLIEDGESVNRPNSKGETPLHLAVRFGNIPACELLLEKGANVYAKTNDGVGISNYGKVFERKVGNDTGLYVAIMTCRNLVREHDPQRKTPQADGGLGKAQLDTFKGSKLGSRVGVGGSITDSPSDLTLGEVEARQLIPSRGHHTTSVVDSAIGSTIRVVPDEQIHTWNRENNHMKEGSASQGSSFPQTLFNPQGSALGIYNMPQAPQDFPRSLSSTPKSPKVQEIVKGIEGKRSTKSLPSMNVPRHNVSSAWRPGDPPSMWLGSIVESHNGNVLSSSVAQRFASENPYPHGHISHTTMAEQSPPVVPPIPARPLAREPTYHIPEPVPIPSPQIVLSGYLKRGPDGQNVLICPLPNDADLRYLRRASRHRITTAVQIAWPSEMDQPQRAEGLYGMDVEESAVSYIMPGPDTPAGPTWAVAEKSPNNGSFQFDNLSYSSNLGVFDPPNSALLMSQPYRANGVAFEPNFPLTDLSVTNPPNRAGLPIPFHLDSTPTYPSVRGVSNEPLLDLEDYSAPWNRNPNMPRAPNHESFYHI